MSTWSNGPDLACAGVYAGIGSRETPADVISLMTRLAERLARMGWVLRSGGALGTDSAFEAGAAKIDTSLIEVYIPWEGFEGKRPNGYTMLVPPDLYGEAEGIAKVHHPAWPRLSFGAKKLHTRNVLQVLGEDLDSNSDFVICWTPNASGSGGTGQALRIAKSYGITIYDLGNEETFNAISDWLQKEESTNG